MTVDQWYVLFAVIGISLGIIVVSAYYYQLYMSPDKVKARQLKKIRKSQEQFFDW